MTGTALFVGDISLDLSVRARRLPEPDEKLVADEVAEAPGGVVANAAIAAARAGADVRLAVRLGDDSASAVVERHLADARIAPGIVAGVTLHVGRTRGPLCRVVILVDAGGEKRLLLRPGVSMYPAPVDIAALDLGGVAWIHTAAYDFAAAACLAGRCRQAGIPLSVDLEPATFPGGIDTLAETLRGAAVVFCNLGAAARLGPDPVARLRRLGARAVVTTRGQEGAGWHEGDAAPVLVAAPPTPVRDTSGAGDCLAGWFIAETLRGAAPVAALRRAVAAASWSCGRLGAQASYPRRDQLAASSDAAQPDAR